MVAVAKKCYYSNTSKILLFDFYSRGSYLSACVHFSTLFGQVCSGNSYHGGLDQAIVHRLQISADNVISKGGWSYPADSDCKLTMC